MIDPRQLQIKDFDYPLPDERIAKYPLAERDASKLLVRNSDGTVREEAFRSLPQYIKEGSLMVFNNTKVIQARLHFRKSTGALIEIFCLEPHTPADYQQSFTATEGVSWTCLVGNLKKWKEGLLEQDIEVHGRPIRLTAERAGVSGTGFVIRFTWNDNTVSWSEILDSIGELPIPPYLNRDTEASDLYTYQTVYSKIEGSVAAPTAGLHFTERVLAELDARGVERDEVTLHVGAGTFKPVKSERIEGHTMHAEWISVTRRSIERLLAHGAQCVAVGTTSVRTLESLYYIGVRLYRARMENRVPTEEDLLVPQWLPYEYAQSSEEKLTATEALEEVMRYLDDNQLPALHTATQIIIAPSYHFNIVKTIVTNFHQPQSTLLLLVSAFVGGAWRPIYDFAMEHDFRFLSYGDSSILFPNATDMA